MTTDLSRYMNTEVHYGEADFKISLKPIGYLHTDAEGELDGYQPIMNRFAVVREPNGTAISIVSDRYTIVEHKTILQTIQGAIETMDLGEVPRGIYVDRGGARMRALFKFPTLSRSLGSASGYPDTLCPCIKIQNTYDGTSRVIIHIGAFRFVCTNLAVGGGGCFAGGFMAIHQGVIPVEEVGKQLETYLLTFEKIIEQYRVWKDTPAYSFEVAKAVKLVAVSHRRNIMSRVQDRGRVYDAYNVATDYATHHTRTANTAFEMLAQINAGFQKEF